MTLSPLGDLTVKKSDGSAVSVALANLVSVQLPVVTNLVPRVVLLRNGSAVAVANLNGDPAELRFVSHGRKLSLATIQAAAILFRPVDLTKLLGLTQARPGLLLANGDFVDGELAQLEGTSVALRTVLFGIRRFHIDREAVALVLHPLSPTRARYEVRTVDGSLYRLNVLPVLQGDGWSVMDVNLGETRIPFGEVTEFKALSPTP